MRFNKALRNLFIVLFSTLMISACATGKKAADPLKNDVYTGTDTVEYLLQSKDMPTNEEQENIT